MSEYNATVHPAVGAVGRTTWEPVERDTQLFV